MDESTILYHKWQGLCGQIIKMTSEMRKCVNGANNPTSYGLYSFGNGEVADRSYKEIGVKFKRLEILSKDAQVLFDEAEKMRLELNKRYENTKSEKANN